jgi:hypothetical protein
MSAECPVLLMLRTPVVVPRLWVPNDRPLQHTSIKCQHSACQAVPCAPNSIEPLGVSTTAAADSQMYAQHEVRSQRITRDSLTPVTPCSGPRRPPSAVSHPAALPAAPCWHGP